MKELIIFAVGFAILFWIGVKLQRWINGTNIVTKNQKKMIDEIKRQNNKKKVTRKIVYIDMDNTLVDFQSGIDLLSNEQKEKFREIYDEVPGIFSKMKPMKGAIEGVESLAKHYDVYILSTAPWNNPSAWSDKLLWIKEYLGETCYKRLILSHHKHLNKGDFLIDDREKNGAGNFEGELILFGSEQFPDWDNVLNYLLQ